MMPKVKKEDIVKLIKDLQEKDFTLQELAGTVGRTYQTLWRWSSEYMDDSIPCLSDYNALKELLKKEMGA